jgi:hypothetical protein
MLVINHIEYRPKLVINKPMHEQIFNYYGDEEAIETYLKLKNRQSITLSYEGNRTLMFSSELFHKVDEINF